MTNDFARMKTQNPPPQPTAATLPRLGNQLKAQLKAWRHTTERHEQIVLARKTSGSKVTERWLEEVERKIGDIGTK